VLPSGRGLESLRSIRGLRPRGIHDLRPCIEITVTIEQLTKLAERWEREAGITLGNSNIAGLRATDAETCRAAHGYLLHCAGQLRDAIGVPRVLDEQTERQRAHALLYPPAYSGNDPEREGLVLASMEVDDLSRADAERRVDAFLAKRRGKATT
jgi:hypothetical protein